MVNEHSRSEGDPHAVLAGLHLVDLASQLLTGNAVHGLKGPGGEVGANHK